MDEPTRRLQELIGQYWAARGEDARIAEEILTLAMRHFPTSAFVAANCLPIIERCLADQELQALWKERLDGFREQLETLIRNLHLIDVIGDPESQPQVIFEMVGDNLEGVDLSGFDPEALDRVRVGVSRGEAAVRFLHALGENAVSLLGGDDLVSALGDYQQSARQYQARALLTGPDHAGFVLGLRVSTNDQSEVRTADLVGDEMKRQARRVLGDLFPGQGITWSIQWATPYEGASIGVPLHLAGLVLSGKLEADPLMAATGEVDVDGSVHAVSGIVAKLDAAVRAGIRRVVLPEANAEDAEKFANSSDVQLIFVRRVQQLPAILFGQARPLELTVGGTARAIRALAAKYGLEVCDQKPLKNGEQVSVADGAGKVHINVYTGEKGSIVVSGSEGSTREAAERLIDENVRPAKRESRTGRTFMVAAPERRRRVHDGLMDIGGAKEEPDGSMEWKIQVRRPGGRVTVCLYSSGKCTVSSGPGSAHDAVTRVLEEALAGLGGVTRPSPTVVERPNPSAPHIGTDEAGKGDYFGPLVSAAVYVDERLIDSLANIGVRDSKKLSDKRVRALANEIRSLAEKRYSITRIGPRRYNSLYAQMRKEGKNLNTLLAWGHARSIEDLLRKRLHPTYALVDQFADVRYLEAKILADTRQSGLPIVQFPKAESDIAVAAASILARDNFLEWLATTSRDLGVSLPKGASDLVIDTAKRIVLERGEQALRELAKMSFKTSKRVLS